MKRRKFLTRAGGLGLGLALVPLIGASVADDESVVGEWTATVIEEFPKSRTVYAHAEVIDVTGWGDTSRKFMLGRVTYEEA